MRKIFIIALCMALGTLIQAQEALNSFNRIVINGAVIVTLKKGDKPQYEATGDTEKLKIKVDDGKLRISRIDVSDGFKNRAYVTVWYTDLRSVYASTGAQISHEGTLNAGDFELNVDTGSNGEITIDAQSLDVRVGEGGILRIDGAARVVEAAATTGGILKAKDLVAQRVYASCNTGASITLQAKEELEASASMGGSIIYSGDPEVLKIKESLGGSVRG